MTQIRKNIDISEEAVKELSKMAIDHNSNFKNFVETLLEKLSKDKTKVGKIIKGK